MAGARARGGSAYDGAVNDPRFPAEIAPGAPPGQVAPAARRFETIGTLSLVLGLTECLSSLYQLLGSVMGRAMIEAQQRLIAGLLAGAKGAGAATPPAILGAVDDLMRRISVANALRALPFLVASAVLVAIALRLRRGDTSALRAARTWAFAALGVVAISALVQLFVTVPAMLEYGRRIAAAMPVPTSGRGAPPFDVGRLVNGVMLVSSLGTAIVGSLVLAVWPVALIVWAGKLDRELAQPPPEG